MNDSTFECYELLYKERCKTLLEEYGLSHIELNNYDNYKDILNDESFKMILNKKQARKNKRYRVKVKFKEMYQIMTSTNSTMVFGTLTLDDDHLKLKEDTYIRQISKWLKKHFIYVILNKDFGKKTEREHYHFVGLTREKMTQIKDAQGHPKKSKKGYAIYELDRKDYNLGFEPTLCIIDFNKDDLSKTINYLLKLNNHSTKSTNKARIRVYKNDYFKVLLGQVRY